MAIAGAKPKYRLGRIIGAYLLTRMGKRELHPAVIVTPDHEIIQPENHDPRKGGQNRVLVIGVSTKYKRYSDPSIPLPFHPAGHPVTKLKEDCAAIIGWYDIISIPDDVHFCGGGVPPALMIQLNDQVRKDILKRAGKEAGSLLEIIELLLGR
jgi:hypothetical protein